MLIKLEKVKPITGCRPYNCDASTLSLMWMLKMFSSLPTTECMHTLERANSVLNIKWHGLDIYMGLYIIYTETESILLNMLLISQ